MAAVNAGMNPMELQRTMQAFAAQSAKMEMTDEMMDDLIDEVRGGEEGWSGLGSPPPRPLLAPTSGRIPLAV